MIKLVFASILGMVIGSAVTLIFHSGQLGDQDERNQDYAGLPGRECSASDVGSGRNSVLGGDIEQERLAGLNTDSKQLERQQPGMAGSGSGQLQIAEQEKPVEFVKEPERDSTGLPEIYKHLLAPQAVSRRRMTPQENHKLFSHDVRDESWAYTMELGMKQYLAANQNANAAIIEYIECRSRMCEVAGVVHAGGQDDFSDHLDVMRESGWWQLSSSQHTTGAVVDDLYRFVTFIPRYDDDTFVDEFASSICD